MKYIQIILTLLLTAGLISSQEAAAAEAKVVKSKFVVLDTTNPVASYTFNIDGMGTMRIVNVQNLKNPNKTCTVDVESLARLVLAKKKIFKKKKPITVTLKAHLVDWGPKGTEVICAQEGKDCLVTISR